MPDWADEKALALLAESFVEHTEECQHALWNEPGCTCGHEELRDSFAAALREAREQGAREERRACYEAVTLAFAQFRSATAPFPESRVSGAIAARGPMSQEGGGE